MRDTPPLAEGMYLLVSKTNLFQVFIPFLILIPSKL